MKKINLLLVIIIISFSSCSINQMAVNMAADMLASSTGGVVFTGDDDPVLIGDALPLALKIYESLLEQTPENPDLLLATGSYFVMYANAFVQTPAEMLPVEAFAKKRSEKARAKKLYLRGRDYLLRGLEVNHSGFNNLIEQKSYNEAMELMTEKDIDFLYWSAAGWMAAISIDFFDTELILTIPAAFSLMNRALEIDESYEDGSIHDFFISYYGGLPEGMGGSKEKAREHFKKAVQYSKGGKASPYVSLATAVSIKTQDYEEFRYLLNKALSIDVDAYPKNRLVNVIAQQKAQWLLNHIDDYFLIE